MFYMQLLVVMLWQPAAVPVQPVPAFSGVWQMVDITPKPEGGATSLPPSDLTVTQSATTVSLSRTTPWGDVISTVYSLDGREDKNKSGAVTRVTRSRWAGASLVTEGRMSQVTSQGHAAWTFKETFLLDPRGQLVIERHSLSDTGEKFHNVATYKKKAARQ